MEIKETIQFVIIALVVSIFTNVLMPAKTMNLGGNTIHPLIEDFVAGIKVNGTTFIDSSRNVSAGTLTASTISGTTITGVGTTTIAGNIVASTTASTTMQLGNKGYTGCIALGMGDGTNIMWIRASSTAAAKVEGSTTRFNSCAPVLP